MKSNCLRKGAFVLSKYTPIHDEAYVHTQLHTVTVFNQNSCDKGKSTMQDGGLLQLPATPVPVLTQLRLRFPNTSMATPTVDNRYLCVRRCAFSCPTSGESVCRRTSRHTGGCWCVSGSEWLALMIVEMTWHSVRTCTADH